MNSSPIRLYYIDWLRVLAMFGVFFFHADRFFDFYDWHVKNSDTNLLSSLHIAFFSIWLMPLFFVLSGASIFYSMKKATTKSFITSRVKRLLIPLILVGYFVISPPQMYFERYTHGKFNGNFIDFIPHYFDGVDMFGGNFPWHSFHLWYVLYLFIFSLLLFPLFKPLGANKTSILQRASRWLETPWGIMTLVVPLLLIEIFTDLNGLGFMRGTGGWGLLTYLVVVCMGYMLFCNPKVIETIKKIRTISLITAILLSVAGLTVIYGFDPKLSEETPILYLTLTLVRCLAMLYWLVAIVGFGEKFLNFKNRFLVYSNEAVLPFYILHQTILLIIGFFIVQWDLPSLAKYLLISATSFLTIMLIYHYLIRPLGLLRVLFGLRPWTRHSG